MVQERFPPTILTGTVACVVVVAAMVVVVGATVVVVGGMVLVVVVVTATVDVAAAEVLLGVDPVHANGSTPATANTTPDRRHPVGRLRTRQVRFSGLREADVPVNLPPSIEVRSWRVSGS